MASTGHHDLIALAQRLAVRGPGGAAFALFDLASKRVVFSEIFSRQHYRRDLRIVVSPGGDVGFTYIDETANEVVLVHYRLELH